MQDNNDTLTIKSSLTKIGKKRSAQGKLEITKVAFADDGINYSLINDNLSNDTILPERQPLFDVWADNHSVLKNKILIKKPDDWKPNNKEFGTMLERMDSTIQTRVANRGTLQVPTEDVESGFRTLKFYGTDNQELSRQVDTAIEFVYTEVFGRNVENPRYVTVTLFDNTYFDVSLTPDNVAKYSRVPSPRQIEFFRDTERATELLKDPWNRAVHALLNGREERTNIVDTHLLTRNYPEAFLLNSTDRERTPKTLNVLLTPDDEGNNFFLRYRGNYNYANAGIGNYQTFLSIMDERTGQTEYIKLSVIPESKPSN